MSMKSGHTPAYAPLVASLVIFGCSPTPEMAGLCSPDLGAADDGPVHTLAVQTFDGLFVLDDGERRFVPGSEGVDGFSWNWDGSGFFITRDGTLASVSLEGEVREIPGDWQQVRFPAPSPDGHTLAVSANRTDDPGLGWELWLLDAEGGQPRALGPGYNAAWSPNGETLYFELFEPSVHLVTLNLNDGHAQPFPTTSERDISVAISPKGTFASFSRGHARRLMLYSFADQSVVLLTGGSGYDQYPSFSPDEDFIVFARQIESAGEPVLLQIVSCELATGRGRILEEGGVLAAMFAPGQAMPNP